MADFLFDERVFERLLCNYRESSSEILSGNPGFLERGHSGGNTPDPVEIPARGEPLLELEKERVKFTPEILPRLRNPHQPSAHREHSGRVFQASSVRGAFCDFILFRFTISPPPAPPLDKEAADKRIHEGRQFEKTVMARLRYNGATVVRIAEKDVNGNLISMEVRHQETIEGPNKITANTARGKRRPSLIFPRAYSSKTPCSRMWTASAFPISFDFHGKRERMSLRWERSRTARPPPPPPPPPPSFTTSGRRPSMPSCSKK